MGFYTGARIRMISTIIHVAIALPMYDYVSRYMMRLWLLSY